MSKILSLKYLLLDIISKKNITPNIKDEVAYSLEVKISGTNYLIQCLVLGKSKEIIFPTNKFSFYSKDQDSKTPFIENKKFGEEIVEKIIK
jgi:hypothetical protein